MSAFCRFCRPAARVVRLSHESRNAMWALLTRGTAAPLLDGYRAFLRADHDQALEDLRFERLTATRMILEAHILYWGRRRSEAATVLENGLRVIGLPTDDPLAALARSMQSATFAVLGETARSAETMASVDPARYINTPVGDQIAFYLALAAWALKRYGLSATLLNLIHKHTADLNLQARSLILRGWLHATAGKLEHQLESTLRALALLESHEEADVGLMAMALRILAALARDRLDLAALAAVERHTNFPWTSSLVVERFQVARTIAWARAMHGDYIRAGEEFNAARRLAPTPHLQTLAHLDRAWLAQISHESLHARLELREAHLCAEQIDWEKASDDEIGALILAAELTAETDPEKAQALLDLASTMSIKHSAGFAHDDRLRAFSLAAESAVLKARGQKRVAIRRATEALDIFASVGYQWRAANIALSLHEMTGKVSWLNIIGDVSAAYPRSFIAAEYERLSTTGRSAIETLTNRQREIVSLIRDEGLGNDGIAQRLVMSANTVRIHKQKIFRAFRVSNEFQLLAKLNSLAS